MTKLNSPGVSVSVTDEIQTITSGQGTIPLIVLATAKNKFSIDGVTIAPGTQETGILRLNTSQRDLLQRYGSPIFEKVNGTVVQGSEISEYGLHQAFSYLGIANSAYTIRADIDLAQLKYSTTPPTAAPANGTYWFNTLATKFGLFKANGNTTPGLAWDVVTLKKPTSAQINGSTFVPLDSFGANGDVAVVTQTTGNLMFEKVSGSWYNIGSAAWKAAHPTIALGTAVSPVLTATTTLIINGTTITLTGVDIASLVIQINGNAPLTSAGITASGTTQLTLTNANGTGFTLGGTARTTLGLAASYAGYSFTYSSHVSVPDGSHSGDFWVKTTTPNSGADFVVQLYSVQTGQFAVVTAPFYVDDAAANTGYGTAKSIGSLYVQYNTTNASPALANQAIKRWDGSTWSTLVYTASETAPTSAPAAGTLWISDSLKVDIMVNQGSGTTWKGYLNAYPSTDPAGVQITATAPTAQSDGTPLVANDLWLDSGDLVNYPKLHRWDSIGLSWVLIDNTDQTTPFGIVFADARNNSTGAETGASDTASMLASDFVDADAPDPRTYPAGTLLFNTRFSTYNVKEWAPTKFLGQASYTVGTASFSAPSYAARWVNASGNKIDGSPYMGRFAQHQVVVNAMNELLLTNDAIRSEFNFFNLMSCPGYPETILALEDLNIDRKETAFIIADVPMRLKADGTSLQNWATNAANVEVTNEKGRTNRYTYAAEYYPHGFGVNADGSEVVIPSSTIAMRTFAYSDSVAYVWTPPAGTQRGQVQNASSVGYIDPITNEYTPVVLNGGQRDVLFTNNINPIAFLPNHGLTVYGDKTLDPNNDAQSRVNVARLTCFLRYQLDQLAQPFLFQLNTDSTRAAVESVFKRFMGDLISAGAITDFAVVCDRSNNSPTSIGLNELWIDVAIVPAQSINFIYIPLRYVSSLQG